MATNIFLTGGRGLLGATLLETGKSEPFHFISFDGDVTDRAALEHACRSLGSDDWVVHLAAMTDVNACEEDREACYRVNVEGTRNICDIARRCGARMLYCSTVSVFSGDEGGYREQDRPYPKNFYNLSKFVGEELVAGLPGHVILRLNVIGIHPEGSRGKNFCEWLYDRVRQNENLQLFTDIRINPVSAWSAAESILRLLSRQDLPRIVHLGSSDVVSKADVGRMVLERFPAYTGSSTFVTSDVASHSAFRPKRMWLDASASNAALGFIPKTVREEIETIFQRLDTVTKHL